MIAPATVEDLVHAARGLGYSLTRRNEAVPIGVEADLAAEQSQYALCRGTKVEFDGTARECAAYLIGTRDLRARLLAELLVVDPPVMPEMSARTPCQARDAASRRCLAQAGHPGSHSALVRWEDSPP